MLTNSSISIIFKESLNGLFFFNKISSPRPALEHSPEITAPKPIAPLIYINVIAIDIAQLGIKPAIAVITGCNMELCKKYCPKFSSPPARWTR